MSAPSAPLKVLVADDDADQRFLLRRLLAREGLEDVVEATDGASALRIAEIERPDLIVLDLAMPGRSGLDVLPELHDRVPEARIVVLSNAPRHEMGEVTRHRGAVGYVEKAVPTDRLVHELLVAAAVLGGIAGRTSARLPPTAASAGTARRFIRRSLGAPDDSLVSDVELLVSELVTNAVVHAASSPRLDVVLTADRVRVEVHDDDPTMPRVLEVDAGATGGRGMFLLDRIASRWGAEPHGGGKVVWFERDRLPVAPPGTDGD